jgi:hypothetical protein
MKKKSMPDREIGKRTAATKDYDELLPASSNYSKLAVARQRVPFTRS